MELETAVDEDAAEDWETSAVFKVEDSSAKASCIMRNLRALADSELPVFDGAAIACFFLGGSCDGGQSAGSTGVSSSSQLLLKLPMRDF